ncbi:MAG: SRPBCC family protein [Bacteroidetes bacterium]|nr:SRPBCC family protein [Bacteroidota bacterium]
MTKVNVTKSINVSAESVWTKLSVFSGIEHFSPIARSVMEGEGVGAKRSCYLPNDAEIKETLDKLNNETMDLQYSIQSGPFPISGYVSDVSVKSVSDSSCEISWSAQFNVEGGAPEADMTGLFEGFYNTMIESLETLIQSEN